MRYIWILILVFTISACGGGGSSDATVAPIVPNPVTPTNPDSRLYEPLLPNYVGLTSDYKVNRGNVAETAINVLYSLDFINSLTFGDLNNSFLFIEQESQSIAFDDDTIVCQLGSTSFNNNEALQRIEVIYNRCVIDGVSVNGTVRASLNSAQDVIVNVDVSFTDQQNSEVITMLGHYRQASDTEIIVQMTIDGLEGEQIWFDDFELFFSTIGDVDGLQYQGDIYVSDAGKLIVSTIEFRSNGFFNPITVVIDVAGDGVARIEAQLQEQAIVALDSERDTLIVPLSPYFQLPDQQLAPVVSLISDNNLPYDQVFSLNASDSSDPNIQYLDFSWRVIQQVQGSQVLFDNIDSPISEFTVDVPGEYVIELTVTDPDGLSTSQTTIVNVNRLPPVGYIQFNNSQLSYAQEVSGQVVLVSPEFDGPFEYHIAYGPSNLEMTDSGELTWDGVLPNLNQTLTVNFGVYVISPEHKTTLTGSVNMSPQSRPLFSPAITKITPSSMMTHHNDKTLAFNNRFVTEVSLGDNMLTFLPAQEPDFFPTTEYSLRAVNDTNGDGVNDFWFVSDAQGSLASKQVNTLLLDGKSGESIRIFTSVASTDNFIYAQNLSIRFADFNLDTKQDLILSRGPGAFEIYDIDTGVLLVNGSNKEYTDFVCDINKDGFAEVIDSSSSGLRYIDLLAPADQAPVTVNEKRFTKHTVLKGEDGKHSCFVMQTSQVFAINSQPADRDIYLFNLETKSTTRLVNVDSLVHSNREVRLVYVKALNIDDDPQSEILFSFDYIGNESEGKTYLIDNPLSSNPKLSLVADKLLFIDEDVLTYDVNQDGQQDVVFYPQQTSVAGPEFARIAANGNVVYTFSENALSELATSGSATLAKGNIIEWSAENHIAVSNDNEVLTIGGPKHINQILQRPFYGQGSVEEGQGLMYILDNDFANDFTLLRKFDANNNQLWVTDVLPGSYDSQQNAFHFIDQNLMALSSKNNIRRVVFLNRQTGETLFVSEQDGYLLKFGYQQLATLRSDDKQVFVFISSSSEQDSMLIEVDNELNFSFVSNESTQAFFADIEQTTSFAFLQTDNDKQPELVKQLGFTNSEQNVQLLDMLSYRLDTVDQRVFDLNNLASLTIDNGGNCLQWDNYCRNYINIQSSLNSGSSAYWVEQRDKINGELIWSTNRQEGNELMLKSRRLGDKIIYLGTNHDISGKRWFVVE